ncbi:MAG: 16S rRNA (guanine(966)-N(2))-methyltransferase RsmD, partial [Elusimicrobiota bacterium]
MSVRITAGMFKNRKLKSIPGKKLRPIAGRLKEPLFSILGKLVKDAVILDCFAGTGSVGLEALSRGAEKAVFIEKDKKAVDLIKQNVNNLGVEEKVEIINRDFFEVTENGNPKILFAGPPYRENLGTSILKHIRENKIVSDKTIIIIQHHYKE